MTSDSEEEKVGYRRPPKAGRIRQGERRNPRGRPPKPTPEVMPYETALEFIEASEMNVEARSADGSVETMSARKALFRKALMSGIKDGGASLRTVMQYLEKATQTIEAHKRADAERFAEYVRAKNEGRPWKLDKVQAAHMKRLADELGYPIEIDYVDPTIEGPEVSYDDVEPIVRERNFKKQLGVSFHFASDQDLALMVRLVLKADRRLRAQRKIMESEEAAEF